MSFHGALEDLPLVDVLQFIHLGRRTGTLYLWLGKEQAEIGFHDGKIVSAWRPDQPALSVNISHTRPSSDRHTSLKKSEVDMKGEQLLNGGGQSGLGSDLKFWPPST